MSPIKRPLLACVAATSLLGISTPALADEGDWATASDVTRDALVLAALGVPLAKGDTSGMLQAGLSIGAAGGTAWVLKETFPEIRPDGSDNKSFPSGHTAVSFASAATLQNRYGWKIGIPAHVAAAFVGVARVEADKHYWHDVAVGAAIGELAGLLLTKKENDNVQILPWTERGGGGATLAMRF